jgi:alpha-glucosidase
MEIKMILNAIKSIGVAAGRKAIQYSIFRDFSDGFLPKLSKENIPCAPGELLSQRITPDGAVSQFKNATLSVKYLCETMVRITWEPGKLPIPYTIANLVEENINVNHEQSENGVILSSKELRIMIGNHGEIRLYSSDGSTLRTDNPPQIIGDSWRQTSQLRDDEHVYGLGERAATFNLIGHTFSAWNTDPGGSYSSGDDPLYICTPVMMALGSTRPYLIYYENSFPATFNINTLSTVQFSGGALRYYFIYGAPEVLLSQYTTLTGRPPLPPRWVFGYHQSRWGYHSETEIRDIINQFGCHQLPISAIHLDIDYMDGFRVFTSDKIRFPDLRKLSTELEEKRIHLVTIIDPGVKKDTSYWIYQDGVQKDVFCKTKNKKVLHGVVWPGWAAYPDFTDQAVREWWGNLYRYYLDAGISGFWHDMNEPVSFSAWGKNTLPLTTQHKLEGERGNHPEAHNLYGLLMNQGAYDAIRSLKPEQRPWLISRSGWAGLQRYAWNWTGDVASTWEALRQTLITLIGLSLSGHFFSGSDIGGFSGNPSAELYLRWFQLSTFFPFFRTHSAVSTNRREPWSFGEPYTSIIRQYLLLRYQLVPYIYTMAWRSNQHGLPVIRPLFWHHSEWSNSWDVDDQFYLGDDILIAPVLSEDCDSRNVVLPPGVWYFLWDDSCYTGPTTLTMAVSLERVPVFIRAGSILPKEKNSDIEFHIYPTEEHNASGILYSDQGDGYGDWRVDELQCQGDDNELNLSWKVSGDYPFPYNSHSFVLHGNPIRRILLNEEDVNTRYASELDL